MRELHSATSLALRLGVSRATALAAIETGKLKATIEAIGTRRAYRVDGDDIAAYKGAILAQLEQRIAKVTTDPIRAKEQAGSAAAALRDDAAADVARLTPAKLMDDLNVSRELAIWLLGKYATRVDGGWTADADQMQKIRQVANERKGLRK